MHWIADFPEFHLISILNMQSVASSDLKQNLSSFNIYRIRSAVFFYALKMVCLEWLGMSGP